MFSLGLKAAQAKDWKQAFVHYSKAVGLGSKEALVKLGLIYHAGMNVAQVDWKRSYDLFLQAHHAGVVEGTIWLGYHVGDGIARDLAMARELLLPLCSTEPLAAAVLATFGVDQKQLFSGFSDVLKLSASGDPWVSFVLANAAGAAKDSNLKSRIEPYDGAAHRARGHAGAQCDDPGPEPREEKDEAKAVEYYRQAAVQGHAQAQFYLGVCYHDGAGLKQDFSQAFAWFSKAAAQGCADAQFHLGMLYREDRGVRQDLVSFATFSKAARVKQNLSQAFAWFSRAAAQGHTRAQVGLGELYRDGQGVKQDRALSSEWFRKAADEEKLAHSRGLGNDDLKAVDMFRPVTSADSSSSPASPSIGDSKSSPHESSVLASKLAADLEARLKPVHGVIVPDFCRVRWFPWSVDKCTFRDALARCGEQQLQELKGKLDRADCQVRKFRSIAHLIL